MSNRKRRLTILGLLLAAAVSFLVPQLTLLVWFLAFLIVILYVILTVLKELSQTASSRARV